MLSTVGVKRIVWCVHVNQKSYNCTVELLWTHGVNRDQSIPALQKTKLFPVTTACCSYKSKRSFKNREAEESSGTDLGLSWPLKWVRWVSWFFSPHHFGICVHCVLHVLRYSIQMCYIIGWIDKRMGRRKERGREGGKREGQMENSSSKIGHSCSLRRRASTGVMWGLL